jgi:hypothetical protein
MRRGKLIDTEKLIGQKNRADEAGEAPESFTMRESPYTILELAGMGLVALVIGLYLLTLRHVENADVLGWILTVAGGAGLLASVPMALYRIRVDGVGLRIGYGPVTTKTILWSDVRSVKVIRVGGDGKGKRIKPHWVVKEMGLYGEKGCLFHGSHTQKGFTYLVRAAARSEFPAEEVERFSLRDMAKGGL